jgi:flagellar protein FlbT
MDPSSAGQALVLFRQAHAATLASFDNEAVVNGLKAVAALVERSRIFDALRMIRALFDVESDVLALGEDEPSKAA